MNRAGGPSQSSTTVLSSMLSLYLLKDIPSPPSALPTILRLFDDRKPFLSIASNSQVLHKWNTRVSSLIQSKSAESRYWGVCLANATISNGGEGVGHAVVWAKLLLAILNRPEGSVLLERTIVTLTKSFGLINTHPAFSRDLNSLLPGFFTLLLNLMNQSSLLPAILTSLHTLIPDHANAFRPSLGQAGTLMLSLIDGPYSPEIKRSAAKVYVDLHHCAQKGTSSEHWRSCLLGVIAEIHVVLDQMFEVVEENGPHLTISKGIGMRSLEDDYPVFIISGIDRIRNLITVIKQFLSLPTRQPVNVPLGHLVDLAMRVYAVGTDTRARDSAAKQNISLLYTNLSTLYTQINDLLLTTAKCVDKSFLPHFRSTLRELSALLATSEGEDPVFKTSTFGLLTYLLRGFGAGLHSTSETKLLESLTRNALNDIATLNSAVTIPSLGTSAKSRKRKHDSNHPIDIPSTTAPLTVPIIPAISLITEILHLTPLLSMSTRSSIDQVILSAALKYRIDTDILCALHQAIVASVKVPVGVSVLPHAIRILQRDCSASTEIVRNSAIKGLQEIETIIHARLPPQRAPALSKTLEEEDDEDEHGNTHIEISENMMTEGNVVEEAPAEPIVETELDNTERPVVAPSASFTTIPEVTKPSLPVFVTTTQGQSTGNLKEVPSTSLTEGPKPSGDEVTRTSQPKVAAKFTTADNRRDIFASGAWKNIQATGDDEDEEIPEIDMGFDSDDE